MIDVFAQAKDIYVIFVNIFYFYLFIYIKYKKVKEPMHVLGKTLNRRGHLKGK